MITQHCITLGITASEGESFAAVYHWCVQQTSYMDNMKAAREDHTKVTQLLEECQTTLNINDITHEDQMVEDLYVEHLQSYKDRLNAAVTTLPNLSQYKAFNSREQHTYEEVLLTLDQHIHTLLTHITDDKQADVQEARDKDNDRDTLTDTGERMEDDNGAEPTTH